jgi:hypothetical protein
VCIAQNRGLAVYMQIQTHTGAVRHRLDKVLFELKRRVTIEGINFFLLVGIIEASVCVFNRVRNRDLN